MTRQEFHANALRVGLTDIQAARLTNRIYEMSDLVERGWLDSKIALEIARTLIAAAHLEARVQQLDDLNAAGN